MVSPPLPETTEASCPSRNKLTIDHGSGSTVLRGIFLHIETAVKSAVRVAGVGFLKPTALTSP